MIHCNRDITDEPVSYLCLGVMSLSAADEHVDMDSSVSEDCRSTKGAQKEQKVQDLF